MSDGDPPMTEIGLGDPGVPTPAAPSSAARGRRLGLALPPLFVGVLLGFIGGYFAAGGGRPAPAPNSASSAGDPSSPANSASAGGIEALRAELARDPENPRIWTALGDTYYDRKDWDQAVDSYEKALRKAAKDPNVLSDLGAAYRNRGEFKRAVSSFEKAQQADEGHWQSLLNLVLVRAFDTRDPKAAQKSLDELKRRYPDIPNLDRIQEQISRLRAR